MNGTQLAFALLLTTINFAALTYSGQTLLAETLTVEGDLPRDLEGLKNLDLTLIIGNVPEGQQSKTSEEASLFDRVKLHAGSVSNIKFIEINASAGVADRFVFRQVSASKPPEAKKQSGRTLYDIYLYIRITAVATDANIDDLITDKKLAVKVEYTPPGGTKVDLTAELEQATNVPNQIPDGLVVKASHQSLLVTWEEPTELLGVNGKTYGYRGANVYVYSNPDESILLTSASKIFSPDEAAGDPAADDSTACEYVTDGESCSVNCPDNSNAYLEIDLATSVPGFEKSYYSSTSPAAVEGLENGKKYAVFIQYAMDGLIFSECVMATPVENLTLGELNDEKPGEQSDRNCFVATAAYGSPLDERLDQLRWFRDHILMPMPGGARLVAWYYDVGPSAATFVESREYLKFAVRTLLWPFVTLLSGLQWTMNQSTNTLLGLAAIMAGIFAIVVSIRRHKPSLAR
jgi:hypothetical protein